MLLKPSIEQIKQLPHTYEADIPSDYLDEMGHMNVMWYTHLYGQGIRGFLNSVGFDRQYIEEQRCGTFALEKHVRYLSEVRVGENVAVYTRLVDCNGRLYHLMQYLVNETQQKLASTMETVSAHVDLNHRRMAEMPPHLTEAFEATAATHAELDWKSATCGVMGIR
ncbi:acyl-CoA thioesterase [Aeoliella mucimassa]|uniref:L-carnitine dehydrogenase n=1 Tax=Aeoliella mucimassa TaxID=2527972 RepID=A0A518AKV9_9BACT|nr:thioesterase family protein [Aeoliella mucimassa]QDU55367.1 L-carnitine dehydrogenase [Aeoliella mucimassa]